MGYDISLSILSCTSALQRFKTSYDVICLMKSGPDALDFGRECGLLARSSGLIVQNNTLKLGGTSLGVGFVRGGTYFYHCYSLDNQMKVHSVLLSSTVMSTAVSYDLFNSHYITLVFVYI